MCGVDRCMEDKEGALLVSRWDVLARLRQAVRVGAVSSPEVPKPYP